MGKASNLVFDIIANDNASKVIRQVGDSVSGQDGKWNSWRNAGVVATAAVGAAVIKFGADSVDAYADAEAQHLKLENAYEQFPALADVNISKLDQLNAALQRKTGYDDDQTAAAQATLAQFNLTGAQIEQLTPLMVDYAAKTGVDLPTAADQLGKAMLGQGRALKGVGIDFTDAGSTGANFDQVITGLTDKVGGFATNGVSEASRQSKILTAEFGDLQEKAGAQLLPTITALTSMGVKSVQWMNDHSTATKVLAVTFGVLTTAVMLAANWTTITTTATNLATAARVIWTGVTSAGAVATGVATAAQWAWNAAMSANPIGLIIIAVAALVAGIVLLWQHNEGFRNFVIGAWEGIKGAFVAVWDWVKNNWPMLLQILTGPIGIAVVQIVKHWDDIKGAFSAAWNFIKDAWSGAGDFFSGIGDTIRDTFKGAFNRVAGFWNDTVGKLSWTVPDWVPAIGGKTIAVPKIPLMADGGHILRAGLAVVGEAGPELLKLPVGATVSPLNRDVGGIEGGGNGRSVSIGSITLPQGSTVSDLVDEIEWRARR